MGSVELPVELARPKPRLAHRRIVDPVATSEELALRMTYQVPEPHHLHHKADIAQAASEHTVPQYLSAESAGRKVDFGPAVVKGMLRGTARRYQLCSLHMPESG